MTQAQRQKPPNPYKGLGAVLPYMHTSSFVVIRGKGHRSSKKKGRFSKTHKRTSSWFYSRYVAT